MEFAIEKCAMLIMKRGKWHLIEGIEQRNQEEKKNAWRKEIYKYLGIFKADMKEIFFKRVSLENEKGTRNQTI